MSELGPKIEGAESKEVNFREKAFSHEKITPTDTLINNQFSSKPATTSRKTYTATNIDFRSIPKKTSTFLWLGKLIVGLGIPASIIILGMFLLG